MNALPIEPFLSKSLCGALLELSAYFGEHSGQTIRVRPNLDAMLVEALESKTQAPTVPGSGLDELFVASTPSVTVTVVKSWSLPMVWWPRGALPNDFHTLLTAVTLPEAFAQLRDETSAFSTFVRESLSAEIPNMLGSLAPVMLAMAAAPARPAPQERIEEVPSTQA